MQQYIYIIKPVRLQMLHEPSAEEQKFIQQHFEYLENLVEKKILFIAGRTLNNDEKTFGLVIFQAKSEKEAYEIMNNDPAIRSKTMKAELYPYRIALSKHYKNRKFRNE